MKGDGNTSVFVNMINGDYEGFHDQGGAARSINLLVAHDGFTLTDLVSYNSKNNYMFWPFGPSDGGNDNNCSWDSMGNQQLRRQRLRNFWTVQFISRGVPLAVWGDEFGRTQNGNNNPYNIDSVATWNNYAMISSHEPNGVPTEGGGAYHNNLGKAATANNVNPLFHFARYMANLRKTHVALKQRAYGDFALDNRNDVTYLFRKKDGCTDLHRNDRCVWLRIDGSAVDDNDLLVFINMWTERVAFTVPADSNSQKWVRLVDTDRWAEDCCNVWDLKTGAVIKDSYMVNPWSIVILEELKQ
jgi:glycogen operon protein